MCLRKHIYVVKLKNPPEIFQIQQENILAETSVVPCEPGQSSVRVKSTTPHGKYLLPNLTLTR